MRCRKSSEVEANRAGNVLRCPGPTIMDQERRKGLLIELWRKLVAEEYTTCLCAICGNDFDRGNVFPMVSCDDGTHIGHMCPACLDDLNRRKRDAQDPTLRNWPASGWPTPLALQVARRRYPEPVFETHDELLAAAPDRATEESIFEAAIVWGMEPENLLA